MKIRYTRLAQGDLVSHFSHIAEEDERAAARVAHAIRFSIDRLIHFPGYGRPGDVEGTRQFVVTGLPYVVIYEIDVRP